MSIDIVPDLELRGILEHIKEELDKESDSSKIVERLREELSPFFEELSETKQHNEKLENELSKVKLDSIEGVFSRLFEVLSDIRSESSLRKVDDFDGYVDELRKITKPLGMKIYCYKTGESIPEEDLSILELRYQQTNDPNLDKKVCSTESIGFRLNDLDMKRSAKVTVYGFKEDYDSDEYAKVAESIELDQITKLLQQAKEAQCEVKNVLSEVEDFFDHINGLEDIDSDRKLRICISFALLNSSYKKGFLADCLGMYYEKSSEEGHFDEALRWYKIGGDCGNKHSKKRIQYLKKKLKK